MRSRAAAVVNGRIEVAQNVRLTARSCDMVTNFRTCDFSPGNPFEGRQQGICGTSGQFHIIVEEEQILAPAYLSAEAMRYGSTQVCFVSDQSNFGKVIFQ